MTHEPAPQYVVGRIRDRLAQDDRTAELAVDVRVRGHDVYLTGPVSDERQRLMVCQVAAEAAPGTRVHDELEPIPAGEPTGAEELR